MPFYNEQSGGQCCDAEAAVPQVVVSRTMKHVSLIMFTALGLSVLAASFIVVPVKERSSDSMHVQVSPAPRSPRSPCP